MDLEHVAVVGSGYMGGGIAQTLALAGHSVTLADADAASGRQALERLLEEADRYEKSGLIPDGGSATVAAHLRAADSIEAAVADADYIVEAVFEDTAVKRSVLSRISAAARPDAIIATNTSAIALSSLSDVVSQPFIAAHWFNPAPFLPLVELAGSDEAALERVRQMLNNAGKIAVRVPDAPGFLANRLQFALFKEAAAIVEEGLATPEQVDLVVSNSFGYRLPFFGVFAIADIAGLDVYAGAYEPLKAHYGERFAVPESLAERVASGDLGLKTSGGFRGIDADQRTAIAAYRDRVYVALGQMRDEIGAAPGL